MVIFDGLYNRERRGSMNKEQGEPGKVSHIASSLITILFSSTTLYYFANDACLV